MPMSFLLGLVAKPAQLCLCCRGLDNEDGFIMMRATIKVERHIYRSGDSEYRIDGKKAPLA